MSSLPARHLEPTEGFTTCDDTHGDDLAFGCAKCYLLVCFQCYFNQQSVKEECFECGKSD